jgi:hypothetical protein
MRIEGDVTILEPKILNGPVDPKSPWPGPCAYAACWAWCIIEHFQGCGCPVAFSDCGPWKPGACLPPNLY